MMIEPQGNDGITDSERTELSGLLSRCMLPSECIQTISRFNFAGREVVGHE